MAAAIAVAGSVAAPAAQASAPRVERVSLSSTGGQLEHGAFFHAISADGRYVTFESASSLVPDDTNGSLDVFVRDRWSRTTERVSLSDTDGQGSGESHSSTISADGRYVAFVSYAADLIADDTNNAGDIFVRDRRMGTTSRVSESSAGVAADSESLVPTISASGRYVAFTSYSASLVPRDTNDDQDVFVKDRWTGTTSLVSVSSAGVQAAGQSREPAISADGRHVVFVSTASNLVRRDTNGGDDVFVRDIATGTTARVNVSGTGGQDDGSPGQPAISGDGRHVAFVSSGATLVPGNTTGRQRTFVHDRRAGTTELADVSSAGAHADGSSSYPSISADGRYVAYGSRASNLVPGDTTDSADAFVRDRWTRVTTRVSGSRTPQDDQSSLIATISGNGRAVAFASNDPNLVPRDTNDTYDVFVRNRV